MKRIIITLLVVLPLVVTAQEFDVAEFSLLEFDLTAINEATKLVDDNGEDCALIKIETIEKGFVFDGGTIGIAKVEDNHKGEIWVYVPAGLRKISIMHDKFGVIRNYYFPITLVSARTYLMKLKTPQTKKEEEKVAAPTIVYQPVEEIVQTREMLPAQFSGPYQIKKGVTKIGRYAFYNVDYMTSVTIPNTVLSIEEWAFADCMSLTTFIVPDCVRSIANNVFTSCNNLSSVKIPKHLERIENNTFKDCPALKDISLPDSLVYIGHSAFSGCKALTNLTLPEKLTYIGSNAFKNCNNLTIITIPSNVSMIEYAAFQGCAGLTEITFLSANTRLEKKDVFSKCNNIKHIYVPKGARPFYQTQLHEKLHGLIVER